MINALASLMPGEHNWMKGAQMPGQSPVAQPEKRKGIGGGIMNALSTVFEYGAPEAFQAGRQKRMNKDISNALSQGNVQGAAQAAYGAGDWKTGMELGEYGQNQQDAQRKREAQGALQLFTSLQPGQVTQYAMEDPAGFERMTGMSSDEYMQMGQRFTQMGVTPEQFADYVVKQAQAELGVEPKGPMEINGQLVDPKTYDVLGDYRTPEAPKAPASGMVQDENGNWVYSPEYLAGQKEIAALRGGNQGNVQSQFITDDGRLGYLRRDGSVNITDTYVRNPLQTIDVGGVPIVFDRLAGMGRPLATAEEVGTNAATIETIKSNEEARRKTEQDLPKAVATIDRGIATLEALQNSPGFDTRYGFASIIPVIPGTDMADTQALINQIGGQAFLEAFESLKGGGQITENEGIKATQAITILTTQGIRPETAARAIQDLIEVQRSRKERMAVQASGVYAAPGANQNIIDFDPATGKFADE